VGQLPVGAVVLLVVLLVVVVVLVTLVKVVGTLVVLDVVVVGAEGEVVVEVVVELTVELDPDPEPSAARTPCKNPLLAVTWLASQAITPPKDEKPLVYAMIFASVSTETYPLPAAVELPGTPRKTFTFLLSETVLAQVSQVAKLKLFWVVEPAS
jgi:hypothetical protein